MLRLLFGILIVISGLMNLFGGNIIIGILGLIIGASILSKD